jgi:hypothetical protein
MPNLPKRPRDLNQWAKRMVDIATSEASDRDPTPEEQGKDPAAVARGKLGGQKGGNARAKATDRLWEVVDMVTVLEAWEAASPANGR